MALALHPFPQTATMFYQSSEIAPGVYFNSPRWMRNPLAIPLNSAIPLPSVVHLISDGSIAHPRRTAPIPAPAIFRAPSRELRRLRRDEAWQKGGTREEQVVQMDEWFPDVFEEDDDAEMSPAFEVEDEDAVMSELSIHSPSAPTKANYDMADLPSSDIGAFSKLPGEIRNHIYRLAIIEPESKPVMIEMQPKTCSMGTCLHNKASYNLPGIASTCRQLRNEVAPIFLTENTAFTFDDGVVQQCCVNNFLRTLGWYVNMIPQFNFLLKRPIWNHDTFIKYLDYTFTLSPPNSEDDHFTLHQWEAADHLVCQCQLDGVVHLMNMRKSDMSVSESVKEFVDSEEFADFVWKARKTKQWTTHLPKCRKCGEVYFNN